MDSASCRLLLIILLTVSLSTVTEGFQWTSSLPAGATLPVCVGDNVSLPWTYDTTNGEKTSSVQWFRTEGTEHKILAVAASGSFFSTVNTGTQFLPNAGIRLINVTARDLGTYTVRVTLNQNGHYISKEQTAHIALPDSPLLADGRLVAKVLPGTVNVRRQHHIRLACGQIVNHNNLNTTVVWKTPSSERTPSNSHSNGVFFLTLPNPVAGGSYSCHMEEPVAGISCLRSGSRSLSGFVHVDELSSRMLVLEAEMSAETRESPQNNNTTVGALSTDVLAQVSDMKMDLRKFMNEFGNMRSDLKGRLIELLSSTNELTPQVTNVVQSELGNMRSDFTGLFQEVLSLLENHTAFPTELSPRVAGLTSPDINLTLIADTLALQNNQYRAQLEQKDLEIARLSAELVAKEDITRNLTERPADSSIPDDLCRAELEQKEMKIRRLSVELDAKTAYYNNLTEPIAGPKMLPFKDPVRDFMEQPASCSEVLTYDKTDGVHVLNVSGLLIPVFCDQSTDGGGWTVIQRRQDGSQDFYQPWQTYREGFGDLRGEFWLGLDKIHKLTTAQKQTLRVDLVDFGDNTAFAKYNYFRVAGPKDKYRLLLDVYSGTAGDSLTHHNNQAFSTHDNDNDGYSGNCASDRHGAWWYTSCFHSNLNGRYKQSAVAGWDGVVWHHWKSIIALKKAEMKIRPAV